MSQRAHEVPRDRSPRVRPDRAGPHGAEVSRLLRLQQTAGNAAVAELLTGRSAAPYVQRKVGFEFETNLPIRAGGRPIIDKDQALYEVETWRATSDASFLEFATAPFEEEGDAPEAGPMAAAVEDVATKARGLHAAASVNEFKADTPLGKVLGGPVRYGVHDVVVPRDERVYPITAKPQVTGGVTLEHVGELFRRARDTSLPLESPSNLEDELTGDPMVARTAEDKRVLGGGTATDLQVVAAAAAGAAGYMDAVGRDFEGAAALEGMLAMVFSYLFAGQRQPRVQSQAKYFVPLMSRMSFSGMHGSLPDAAQGRFDPARVLEIAKLAPDDPVYAHGFKDQGDAQVARGPARRAWLDSIRTGADLMSAGGGTTVTAGIKASSPAMGQHAALDPDHRGTAKRLVQVEVRRLPGGVPPDEWVPLAKTLFVMFQEIARTGS